MGSIGLAFPAGPHEAVRGDWREVLAEVQLIEEHRLGFSALFYRAFPDVLQL